jgi:phosphatidylglycerophosphate synthase
MSQPQIMENKSLVHQGNLDIVDKFSYPVIFKLVRHLPKSLTPNQITTVGFGFCLLGAVTLGYGNSSSSFVCAGIFLFLHWLCDAMDGLHARNTQQTSQFGAFLDHFYDMGAALAICFALLIRFQVMTPLFVFIVMMRIAVQGGVYLVHGFTQVFDLPRIGPSVESWIIVIALIYSGLVSPVLSFPMLGFERISIIHLVLLPYLFLLPVTVWNLFKSTKKTLIYSQN